jgi:hypothetical protein
MYATSNQVAELQAQIKERDDRIAQFEAMIGSRVPGGGGGGGGAGGQGPSIGHAGLIPHPASQLHHVPPHSTSTGGAVGSTGGGGGGTGRSSLGPSREGTGATGGVIHGFINNQQQAAREQDMVLRQRQNPLASAQGRRTGSLTRMGGPAGVGGGPTSMSQNGGGGRMPAPPVRQSIGVGGMMQQMQHGQMRMMQAQRAQQLQMQHHQQHQQHQQRQQPSRPSSNLSLTGVDPPPTPGNRIRDVSNMPYQFTSGGSSIHDSSSFGGGGGGRANKRRRGTANSGHSRESFGLGMDSSTAGLLNAGPHTMRKY